MEEKKFDLNSLIGMLLLGALAFIFIYQNQPSPEELEQQKLTEQHVKDSIANLANTKVVLPVKKEIVTAPVINPNDSIAVAKFLIKVGKLLRLK